MNQDAQLHYGDLVRLTLPTGAPDHHGDLRTWSVKTVFRVLHPARDGTAVVSDDTRGLRVTFELSRLCVHRRAEHCNHRGE